LLAGSAHAELSAEALPVNRPVTTPMVRSLETVAASYWGRWGVLPPPGAEVFLGSFTQLGGQIAVAELGGHRIWMNGNLAAARWAPEGPEEARALLCSVYIHERGHNAGLLDNDGYPIMEYGRANFTPSICREWATTH